MGRRLSIAYSAVVLRRLEALATERRLLFMLARRVAATSRQARLLSNGKKLRISKCENRISMTVPTLKHYDVVLLEYK